jgi:DNA topoisomerase VI subunit B
MSESIDLTPSPRVLRMLGEIDFKAWECLCEIIDNSIDSFSEAGIGTSDDYRPTVKVTLPGASQNQLESTDYLIIEDNGKGMSFDSLSKSLKAGFSANNPVDKMGLFGMGFNISTARLGHRTEVITSTRGSSEFLKVTIDFQELEKIGHLHSPVEIFNKKADELHTH